MSSSGETTLFDGAFLLSAAAAWLISACILLLAAALLASLAELGEAGLGYLSSALSFLSAAAAGWAAARRRGRGALSTALVTGTMLVIVLLTLGFLIRGEEMDASAILSLVSFTYAGCFTGSLLKMLSPSPQRR